MTFHGVFTTAATSWYGQSGPLFINSLDFSNGLNSQYLHLVCI